MGTERGIPSTSVRDRYRVERNRVYTPEHWPVPLRGDLFVPRASQNASPAVVLIHGGGWSGTEGRWQMEPIASQLVKCGYVVLNITYRLGPTGTFPAPVEDAREAVCWLHAQADERSIDPQRIAVFGYSAGGYLASMVAYSNGPEDPPIRAVVAGGAPSNLLFYPGGDLVPRFLGGTQQQIPERFYQASPVNYISPSSPPTFIYQATEDRLVRPEHAFASLAALERAGVEHEVYWLHGKGHIAAFLLPDQAVKRAMEFLDRHLLAE
jgi:acetyl esterase/lipase